MNTQDNTPQTLALVVTFRPMPESNGKVNWTVQLVRAKPAGPIESTLSSVCFHRGENYQIARYAADCLRFTIGHLLSKPSILEYDDKDLTVPAEFREQLAGVGR
jgi:hypothetical protein